MESTSTSVNVSPLGRSMSVRQINGKRLSDKKQVVGEENQKLLYYMQSSFRFCAGERVLDSPLCCTLHTCLRLCRVRLTVCGCQTAGRHSEPRWTPSRQPGPRSVPASESPWHWNPLQTPPAALSQLQVVKRKELSIWPSQDLFRQSQYVVPSAKGSQTAQLTR